MRLIAALESLTDAEQCAIACGGHADDEFWTRRFALEVRKAVDRIGLPLTDEELRPFALSYSQGSEAVTKFLALR